MRSWGLKTGVTVGLLLSLTGLGAVLSVGTAGSAKAGPARVANVARIFDADAGPNDDCQELTPVSYALSGSVTFDVTVLTDGVSLSHAQAVIAESAESYAGIDVLLRAVGYQAVSFTGADGQGLIDQAKAHFGGVRPAGSDGVLVLTSKDITDSGVFGSALAGLADCIGGVKYADRAFVVSEAGTNAIDDSRVSAHELGHIAGAHHHYANCIEAVLALEIGRPCTIMFNDVGFAARNVSTLNGAMIRGHLVESTP